MFYLACHATGVWESHQNTKSDCTFTQVIFTCMTGYLSPLHKF